jgi:hypothetical protein
MVTPQAEPFDEGGTLDRPIGPGESPRSAGRSAARAGGSGLGRWLDDNKAIVAIARHLLVAFWFVLTERVADTLFCPKFGLSLLA